MSVAAPPKVQSVVVNDGSAQRSEVRSITVTFDTLVTLDAGAFRVTRSDGVIAGLSKAGITVDRKVLSDLAIREPAAFQAIVEKAKTALAA